MKTFTVTRYLFDELDADAKEHAIKFTSSYRCGWTNPDLRMLGPVFRSNGIYDPIPEQPQPVRHEPKTYESISQEVKAMQYTKESDQAVIDWLRELGCCKFSTWSDGRLEFKSFFGDSMQAADGRFITYERSRGFEVLSPSAFANKYKEGTP